MEKRKSPQDFAIEEPDINEVLLEIYSEIFKEDEEDWDNAGFVFGSWFYPDASSKLWAWNIGFYRYVQGFIEGREYGKKMDSGSNKAQRCIKKKPGCVKKDGKDSCKKNCCCSKKGRNVR